VSRPILLDLCSGPGGAAKGYQRAGFRVVGVDKDPQPYYCGEEFHRADALDVLRGKVLDLSRFDAVHASFPCQRFARATAWRGSRTDHPDLVTPGLPLLDKLGLPYVVENVPETANHGLRADLMLCGSMFGLDVKRHRIFQLSWSLNEPTMVCGDHRGLMPFMHKGERAYADAMGCYWMSKTAARQAIPPAYTQWIGRKLSTHILEVAA
jgi:DNA (cytosine-5)-methyltransferase 1